MVNMSSQKVSVIFINKCKLKFDSKDIRTQNHLVCKLTLYHLAKLAKLVREMIITYNQNLIFTDL